jgi:hypothetical protein
MFGPFGIYTPVHMSISHKAMIQDNKPPPSLVQSPDRSLAKLLTWATASSSVKGGGDVRLPRSLNEGVDTSACWHARMCSHLHMCSITLAHPHRCKPSGHPTDRHTRGGERGKTGENWGANGVKGDTPCDDGRRGEERELPGGRDPAEARGSPATWLGPPQSRRK